MALIKWTQKSDVEVVGTHINFPHQEYQIKRNANNQWAASARIDEGEEDIMYNWILIDSPLDTLVDSLNGINPPGFTDAVQKCEAHAQRVQDDQDAINNLIGKQD